MFDALLVARRGLGVEELRLLSPAFASAVRWALVAEKLAPGLLAAEEVAATDPPDELTGTRLSPELRRQKELGAFRARRAAARERVHEWRDFLFPPDDEVSDG